jgi:hypothetical protein
MASSATPETKPAEPKPDRRRFQFSRAPDVSGPVPQGNGSGDHVDDVVKPWPFGWPPYLGVKLRMRVNPRRDSYPDNAGHW